MTMLITLIALFVLFVLVALRAIAVDDICTDHIAFNYARLPMRHVLRQQARAGRTAAAASGMAFLVGMVIVGTLSR